MKDVDDETVDCNTLNCELDDKEVKFKRLIIEKVLLNDKDDNLSNDFESISSENAKKIDRLNKFIKLNRYKNQKTNKKFFTYDSNHLNSNEYETTINRFQTACRNCFYKYILFGCFKVRIPNDD